MQPLPYEIWKIIASYPVVRAKDLYAVNSALFSIAMDLRYQEARLQLGAKTDLRVFCRSHLVCRPTTLSIDLGSITKSLPAMNEEKGCISSLRQIVPSVVNFRKSSKLSASDIVAIVIDALPRLTAVTRLHLTHDDDDPHRDDPLVLQLLGEVWKIFGDRLQHLRVQVAIENLELVLPLSLHLPQLKRLWVTAKGLSSIAAIACESILSTIIQSHASTLRTVSFTTTNIVVDPMPICRSLQALPYIRGIGLFLPFCGSSPSPFPAYHMLHKCRHHLEMLSLGFTNIPGHYSPLRSPFNENWCSVDLPCLKELWIDPPGSTFSRELINYIHNFAPSLTVLRINNMVLQAHQFEQLCSILRDFLRLEVLSLHIDHFWPDSLANLAKSFPGLQALLLKYDYISPHAGGRRNWGDQDLSRLFYEAMQRHFPVFRKWQLFSLKLRYSTHSGLTSGPIERALADNLPNVELFCDVERSAYISQAPKLPPPTSITY